MGIPESPLAGEPGTVSHLCLGIENTIMER
jgi:hypothetical protein